MKRILSLAMILVIFHSTFSIFTPQVMALESPSTTELEYDDGTSEVGVAWTAPGCMFAVQFTPLFYPVKILEVKIFFHALNNPSDPIRIHILDNEFNDLTEPIELTVYQNEAQTWLSVDVSSRNIVLLSGDFFIASEQLVFGDPDIGSDTSSPPQGRSWEFNLVSWSLQPGTNYMIRALIGPRIPLVLIDEGHSEWLVSSNVQFLIQNLEERGYLVQTLTDVITSSSLVNCDVLIIGTAWGSFTQTELKAIEEFVKNGGGLLLTGLAWSWPGGDGTIEGVSDYPMNQIAQQFSGFFNPDIIYDPTDYTTEPASPIFHTPFIMNHPITVGVSEVAAGVVGGLGGFPGSISLTEGVVLITGDDDSYGGYLESPYPNPGMYPPFLGAIEYFLGRIVLVGHEGVFYDGAIQKYDNKILGLNIINWLSLPLTIETTDEIGGRKDVFDILETVYISGIGGYLQLTTYNLYIVEDTPWSCGMDIPVGVSGTETSVTTDLNGNIPAGTVAWSGPLTPGKYDIVIDVNGNGKYDEDIDALDDEDIEVTAGFFVIPELPLGTLIGIVTYFIALATFRFKRLNIKH